MKKQEKNLLWGALLVGGAYWFWMKREEEADVGFYGDYGLQLALPGAKGAVGYAGRPTKNQLLRRLKRNSKALAKSNLSERRRAGLTQQRKMMGSLLSAYRDQGESRATFREWKKKWGPVGAFRRLAWQRGQRKLLGEDEAEMAGYIHEVPATSLLDQWRYG